jgi:hypothetical protein
MSEVPEALQRRKKRLSKKEAPAKREPVCILTGWLSTGPVVDQIGQNPLL